MPLGFFKALNEQPPFADASYTLDDIPAGDLEQAALLAFLTRNYYPLDAAAVTEFVETNTTVDASEAAVRDALTTLHDQDFVSEESDAAYVLNSGNDLVATVHDAYIEYQIDSEY